MLIKGWKTCAIKAVLNSLPIYFLSIFKIPKKVAQEVIKIQRRFLWSGHNQGKVSALVKWEIIQKPKDKGGLGVTNLTLKNAALLFKWCWRYASEEGVVWRKIVNSMHDEDLTLLPSNSMSNIPSPWREIKRLASDEGLVTEALHHNLRVQLGNGAKVRSWEDKWAGNDALNSVFPRLYNISFSAKGASCKYGVV